MIIQGQRCSRTGGPTWFQKVRDLLEGRETEEIEIQELKQAFSDLGDPASAAYHAKQLLDQALRHYGLRMVSHFTYQIKPAEEGNDYIAIEIQQSELEAPPPKFLFEEARKS